MTHHPLTVFMLWIGEVIVTTLLSWHLDFDLNDFRVWSAWALAIFMGCMQFVIHRKAGKQAIAEWYKEMKLDIKDFFGR